LAEYQILYWSDIPLQVRAGGRKDRASQELPARFQAAVDSAAMAANLAGTDDYLNEFTWSEPQLREGTPEEVVAAVVAELDARYPQVPWQKTAARLAVRGTGADDAG
jgi:hypothetical protein